jgi:hypothetical protein
MSRVNIKRNPFPIFRCEVFYFVVITTLIGIRYYFWRVSLDFLLLSC